MPKWTEATASFSISVRSDVKPEVLADQLSAILKLGGQGALQNQHMLGDTGLAIVVNDLPKATDITLSISQPGSAGAADQIGDLPPRGPGSTL